MNRTKVGKSRTSQILLLFNFFSLCKLHEEAKKNEAKAEAVAKKRAEIAAAKAAAEAEAIKAAQDAAAAEQAAQEEKPVEDLSLDLFA